MPAKQVLVEHVRFTVISTQASNTQPGGLLQFPCGLPLSQTWLISVQSLLLSSLSVLHIVLALKRTLQTLKGQQALSVKSLSYLGV